MKAEHTPGKWKVEGSDNPDGSNLIVLDEDGRVIADMCDSCGVEDCEEAEANARLIAAAPDLLEALRDLHDACAHWEDQDDPVLVRARAAIAKAGGAQ